MKKFILMFALMLGILSANAQIATEKSNALDNISFGVTAGVSTPLDFNSMFPLNTNVGLKLQKDFTPVFGLQLEGIAFLNDNHFNDLKTAVKATNVGVNGVFNLSNIFGGYRGTPRTFEVSTVTGIGWLHNWEKASSIVISPAIYWNLNKFGDIHFDKRGSQLAINVTYVYHFKTSNGTHHFKTYDVGAMIGEIDRLNGALSECEGREPVVKIVEKIVEVPANASTAAEANTQTWIVTFDTGKAALSNEAKYILSQVGNDAIVDVIATASPDGSPSFNQKLSEKRAKAVADFLTNRGVRVNSFEGKGVNPETGRSAITTTVE